MGVFALYFWEWYLLGASVVCLAFASEGVVFLLCVGGVCRWVLICRFVVLGLWVCDLFCVCGYVVYVLSFVNCLVLNSLKL